jgi:hypothetical protein
MERITKTVSVAAARQFVCPIALPEKPNGQLEAIHHGYLDMPSTPLFAFGHGLSYTTFLYGPLKLESDTVDAAV